MSIEEFSFERDYFSLLGVATGIELDRTLVRENFMALQRQYHPDRYAASSASLQRRAVQIAAHINTAHQCLQNPLKTAEYLLHLRGVDIDAETDSSMPGDFLMQQMEWREELEEVDNLNAIETLRDAFAQNEKMLSDETADALQREDLPAARTAVRKWQFISKLDREAQATEARFDD